ncbi:MAG: chromosome segregation protein SMC [Vulcanimicrobiaceae bacterium]
MKLKRIKAFGFKTFAEPTTLEFSGAVTAIVGPNGSGKSNLVDAFRWVLGETSSKSLRGEKLEDVIFKGNDKRKPLGLAEVSIAFDNADGRLPIEFSEVELTRRAYRAGESEYFINRSQVRLRDIVDLLMGTGLGPGSYAIVSQGQIDDILKSKPTERRALFEETAGISKFLARKNESLRRLDQTEANAIRINDLISELERRIPELETQLRRAKRYRKVSGRVRDLEILSYVRAGASRRAERETLRAELAKNDEARAAEAARVATLSAQLADTRTRAYRGELQLEELRGKAQSARANLSRLEADYAATLARRETLEAQSTQTSEDAARVRAERESLEATIGGLAGRIAPLQRDVESARENELGAQSALAQTRAQLDSIHTRLRAVEAAAAESATRNVERRVQIESLHAEAERLEGELRPARERMAKIEIAEGAAARSLAERGRRLEDLERHVGEARARFEDAERDLTAAREDSTVALRAHAEQSGEVRAAESRLHTIEELENALEGHVPGTRAAVEAWQRGELRGIEGIVSNLIEVEERYARAMDIAFGARLSNIVTAKSEDAERAIEFLNVHELGRATFLPLDTLANREGRTLSRELERTAGIVGYAHTLVRTSKKYESVVRFLIGNVLIVDTLAVGIHLVRDLQFRDTIVTLTGEQIAGGGAITGGRFKRERSILSRRMQAHSLREALVEMHATLERVERDALAATARTEKALQARDGAREALAAGELQIAELRAETQALGADLERAKADAAATRGHLDELLAKTAEARRRESAFGSDFPREAADEEERRKLESDLATARAEIARAETTQAEASARAAGLRERLAALTAERDASLGRLGMLDQDHERARVARESMLAEIGSLLEQTRTAHAHVEGLRRGVGELDVQLEAARRERETLADSQTKLESDVRMAENQERETAAGGETYRTRLAEIEAELGMLVSQFAQNPASDDECRDVEERFAGEDDAVVDELPRLREELARLAANVNLNAEAEREEVAERDAFLKAQLDDLARARETLLQSIREIEQQTQVIFNETFDKVAAAFGQMYARLFPGGEAKMWQTNPENLSETGIEIAVQPPGKKQMPLPMLSGGERAMTAGALILALIEVKPSPFYLLDEVDAAMDDTNVARFLHAVRELSADSQMVLVTHNKLTMELADVLYGVTMREPGVSSTVSVELTSAPEPAIA